MPAPRQLGRLGLGLSAGSVALVATTAVLGPSAAVPVRPGGGYPPYALTTGPSAGLVTGLLLAAVVLGAAGIVTMVVAVRRDWAPDPRRLLVVGCLAAVGLTFLPHVTSADPESYAAYGRLAVTGLDPYDNTPEALSGSGDPYGDVVESPWRATPSVYGPLATYEAEAAARVAGDDPRTAVWLLVLLGGIAFTVTALLLYRLAGDPGGQRRAMLLWTCNPLLLYLLVAGGHLETVEIALLVAALALLRRAPFAAGVLGGAAVAVKLPAALVGGGMAWAEHANPRRLVLLGAGAVVALAASYATVGSHVFDQARVASRYTSQSSPWRWVRSTLETGAPDPFIRNLVVYLAIALAVGVAAVLWLWLPRRPSSSPDDPLPEAARAALVLALAWLLVAPYQLPWYDGVAWALIVLLPASRFDWLLLAHTTVLSIAYIPGRDVPLPSGVENLADALRATVSPIAIGLIVVATVVVALARPTASRSE